MATAGDIVIVDFTGAEGTKRRPAVILSSPLYHAHRPDVVLGLLTSNIRQATAPTDYILQDWASAGLRLPTAFRSYLLTLRSSQLPAPIGRLSERDWQEIQACLARALTVGQRTSP